MSAHFIKDDPSQAFQYKGKTLYDMGGGKFYERKPTKHNSKGQRFYWKYAPCVGCGEKTLLPVCQISRSKGKVSCGKKCLYASRTGEKHHNWKEKTHKVRGNGKTALLIWMPNHPSARKGRIYEHRFVVEQKIGRFLSDAEVVHHIDCDSHNNAPENLSLCENGSQHLFAHGSLNYCVKHLLEKGHLAFDDKTKTYFLP